jgi:hypothetical protein
MNANLPSNSLRFVPVCTQALVNETGYSEHSGVARRETRPSAGVIYGPCCGGNTGSLSGTAHFVIKQKKKFFKKSAAKRSGLLNTRII